MKNNRVLVLVSGMLIQFCAGIIYMWSVFREPVATHLSWDLGSASFTQSIMLTAYVMGIMLGGRAQDKIGPRSVCIAGSILISAGMVLTAFVPISMPWLIYITYGILAGFGVGCVYTCTVSTVQKWFPDKRGFATGMIVAAFGLSLVVFAPLARNMLTALDVPGTFLTFGIAFLVICFICSLFMKTPQITQAAAVSEKKQYSPLQMLKTKQFYMIAGSMFFLLPAYFIINPLLLSLGVERGLTEEVAVLGVMITGIASACGRLAASWISDKIGRKLAIMSLGVITIAASLLMVFANGMFFLVCIAFIAFDFGGSAGLYSAQTTDLFGTKSAGQNFGIVMLAFALSSLLSPYIAGMLSGNAAPFYLSAASALISVLCIAGLKPMKQNDNL